MFRNLRYLVAIAIVLMILLVFVTYGKGAPSPSRAEFVATGAPVALYTAVPVASLPSADIETATSAKTTRAVFVFVPHSTTGDSPMMAVVTCRAPGVDAPEAIAEAREQGGLFRLPAGAHVRAVDPVDGRLHSVRIVTDDGFVGSVCADAVAPI